MGVDRARQSEPAAQAPEPTGSLLISAATLADGGVVDVRVVGGVVDSVGEIGALSAADQVLDAAGWLLLPAPAEPHAHFDTALTADRVDNPAGDLGGAIEAWLRYQESAPDADFVERATRSALMALANGATAVRTHVGIYDQVGLRAVEALLQVREALRGRLDLQLVGLTVQLTGAAGANARAMLRDALDMGVDVVGGCPHLDPEPAACNELCLELGSEYGRQLDLHTDETLNRDMLYLEDLAERVLASGFPHGVTASHCVSLGMQPLETAVRVADKVARAGIVIVCNPQTNLFLQARGQHTASPRGLTALRPLIEAGATVAGGGDNLRDPFNPVGRADPLETASLLVTAGHLSLAEAYAAVSSGSRAALGVGPAGIDPGCPAELLAVEASSLGEALASTTSRIVIHRGEVASRTTVIREFSHQ